MLIITRALVASMVIVGTVVISLGAAFGLSVFILERIFGIDLNWIVLAFAVIILMAVGSTTTCCWCHGSRRRSGRINTGIIRSMGSTGTVVTAAGLVFAFTMGSMISGDLAQRRPGGMTIGIGLLLDTLIVRSLMTPSIAAILGPLVLVAATSATAPCQLHAAAVRIASAGAFAAAGRGRGRGNHQPAQAIW